MVQFNPNRFFTSRLPPFVSQVIAPDKVSIFNVINIYWTVLQVVITYHVGERTFRRDPCHEHDASCFVCSLDLLFGKSFIIFTDRFDNVDLVEGRI